MIDVPRASRREHKEITMALYHHFRTTLTMMPDVMLRQLDTELAQEIAIFRRGSTSHAARMISKGTEKQAAIADELEHRRIARWPPQ